MNRLKLAAIPKPFRADSLAAWHGLPPASAKIADRHGILLAAAWHSLAWLAAANFAGILLAVLLLFPSLNRYLGEWTYGRWMPVHINLQLYGWCALPLVAVLMKAYRMEDAPAARWARAALWAWSAALTGGALSWLAGHSSGKLFLDWTGYPRVLFPLVILMVWFLLAWSLRSNWNRYGFVERAAQIAGLAALLCVPAAIYRAADPALYPPINPDSGGPTGASQLESTLAVVVILILLPFLLRIGRPRAWRWFSLAGGVLAAEALLCLILGHGSVSHRAPSQYLSLGSVLLWIPIVPACYAAFDWSAHARRWRIAWICWWSVLVPSGWILFLPGILDRFKYTDGLVGHALLAMAGFVTSLLIFVLAVLLGPYGTIFDSAWAFLLWQGSTLGYIAIMLLSGWIEGANPAFSMVPGPGRNLIYGMRLVLGSLMTLASCNWLFRASRLAWSRGNWERSAPRLAAVPTFARAKVR